MYPSEIIGKRILISPLNWGMGHVSRCIPLTKTLKSQNNQIFIACSDIQRKILKSYVESDIIFINHEEYPFRFKGRGNFISDLLLNYKSLKKRFESELTQVNNLVDKYGIELIISDHRYGFRSEKCCSIFMTHQLHLPLPWYFRVAQFWHGKQISKFEFQWIVDNEDNRLAGKLSDKKGFPNASYIGFLSRFDNQVSGNNKQYQGVLVVSGPSEYYRILFKRFMNELIHGKIDIIIGNEKAFEEYNSLNLGVDFHLSNNWEFTDEIIKNAKKIYGYCGYSTLMDLQYLNCENELIACPGQLEQIYIQKKS